MSEIIRRRTAGAPIRAAVFDWDGTISTLREGWEKVMEPMMLEAISPERAGDPALVAEVKAYIDESTGIQTIFQMRWLCGRVEKEGRRALGEWEYKAEYNRRLMVGVKTRTAKLLSGELRPEDFMISGSRGLLSALKAAGVELYVASGTDHADVVNEIKALGMYGFFDGIAGAPEGKAECGKEKVIRRLVGERGLGGDGLAVFGDGKVEIALGREFGAYTVGVAGDEKKLRGVNPVKREKLLRAGADMIVGDFDDLGFLKGII